MPRSRTSIRSTQNYAERNHGDGRMAFKHDQSGMIGDTAFLWEDFHEKKMENEMETAMCRVI